MTTDQLTYSGHLTACTCWCGIRLAVPNQLFKAAKADSKMPKLPLTDSQIDELVAFLSLKGN